MDVQPSRVSNLMPTRGHTHGLQRLALVSVALATALAAGASVALAARSTRALAAGHAVGLAPGGPSQAASPQVRFESRVDLVTLSVSVLGSGDLPVDGLTAEDFRVLEDGVEQEVALVLSPQDARLDVALLMDVSDSMWPMADAARASAANFLDQLSEDDCVFLLRFTALPGPGIWGVPDDPNIRAAINQTPMVGGSAVLDATAVGFGRLQHDARRCGPEAAIGVNNRGAPPRRRALVVVTDGVDEHSVLAFDDLRSIALQADVPFFPVELGDIALPAAELREAQPDPAVPRAGETTAEARWDQMEELEDARGQAARRLGELRDLSRATGGKVITGGRSIERLISAYAEVVNLLRSYYLIGYYPGSPDSTRVESELPSWHGVEVEVRRGGYRVHTRSGYYRTPIDVVAACRHVQAGIDLNARGAADEALVELGLALQADPYSWGAYYHRGGALILAGELDGAQEALLSAAKLNPGRGDVHKLAFGVSLELSDYQTAWDQAIRAHQAGINMSEGLLLLGQEVTAPADLEERLQAPRVYIESSRVVDPIDEAALRILDLALAQAFSEVTEVGLTETEALADYRLLIRLKELSEQSPRKLEVDLGLWESETSGGDRISRRGVTLSDIEDSRGVRAELASFVEELRAWILGHE